MKRCARSGESLLLECRLLLYSLRQLGGIIESLRRTQSVRPVFQVASVVALLFFFSAAGGAPNIGLAEPEAVEPVPLAPDPAVDPPRHVDTSDLRQPRVRALAAMIYNPTTHEVLWQRRGYERRPIASITKVMTALVFLEQGLDLSRDVVVSRRDVRRANTTYLRRRERVRLKDVLDLALVASDNTAARILARVSGWGTKGFVEQMNKKAAELGLRSTVFTDPSGLDKRNTSTPYDLARLIAHASEQPEIAGIMRKPLHQMRTSRRRLRVRNTNRLLNGRVVVQGGKTGYIDASGYCLATVVRVPGADPLAMVVLGVGSSSSRFRDVTRLVDWVSKQGRSLVVPGVYLAN